MNETKKTKAGETLSNTLAAIRAAARLLSGIAEARISLGCGLTEKEAQDLADVLGVSVSRQVTLLGMGLDENGPRIIYSVHGVCEGVAVSPDGSAATPTMEQQRDAYANDLTEALKLRDRLRAHIDSLRTALVEAREALNCWARHDHGCPGRVEGDEYCTCGLWQSRDVVAKAIAKAIAKVDADPGTISAEVSS